MKENANCAVTITSPNGQTEAFTVIVYDNIKIRDNPNNDLHDLNIGQTLRLEAFQGKTKIDNVTWASDDDSIAAIDANGNVTALAYGSVVITATNKADSTDTATYILNVSALPDGTNWCGTYIIKESDDWTLDVSNLPKVSANGFPYVYYFEEEASNEYVPLNYTGGGAVPSSNSSDLPIMAVLNKLNQSLPVSGGSGVKKIYVAGASLLLLCAAGYAMNRSQKRRRWFDA